MNSLLEWLAARDNGKILEYEQDVSGKYDPFGPVNYAYLCGHYYSLLGELINHLSPAAMQRLKDEIAEQEAAKAEQEAVKAEQETEK